MKLVFAAPEGLQIWDDLEAESFRTQVTNAGIRQTYEHPIGEPLL